MQEQENGKKRTNTHPLTARIHLYSRKMTAFIHFHVFFLGPLGFTVWMKAFIITT